MNNIKWESWAPYLENPSILMGFVALLVAIITFSTIAKNQQNTKLTHKVVFCFLIIAAFVVVVAAYKSIQEPSPIPHVSSVQERQEPITKPLKEPNLGATQSKNIQTVNGSHNTITNQVGATK